MPACRSGANSNNRRSLVRFRRLYGPLLSRYNCIYAGVLMEKADTQGGIIKRHRDCPRAEREQCLWLWVYSPVQGRWCRGIRGAWASKLAWVKQT